MGKTTNLNGGRRAQTFIKDLMAGLIVFLVALPLCLGIALASNAPLFSGLIAGIVGGVVVGILSGSHTSVTGPAAGLTAIVATQIAGLGSFEAFLLAVVFAGILQIALGIIKAGELAAFFPSSVIKGLLAAIGIILIIKQLPHFLGHDKSGVGLVGLPHSAHENILHEIVKIFRGQSHFGAFAIGAVSLLILIVWDQIKPLKKSLVPSQLIVVIIAVIIAKMLQSFGENWAIQTSHLVRVPVADNFSEFASFLTLPDFTKIATWQVYVAGVTIAMVASLETLLNLEVVDKLDKQQRVSPPNRELIAQGVGNITSGMLGGLPITSVVIRGSVNINAGAESKLSAIMHGVLLLVLVSMLPNLLNQIPLSCLAAILLMTGFKLASPKLFQQMFLEGRYQWIPFVVTLVAIVATDLLIGIAIGLAINVAFILHSNLRRPIQRTIEKTINGEVMRIELANQVSFLNRAALERTLREAPRGSKVLIDGSHNHYIDPDIISLIREFRDVIAPAHDVNVTIHGFSKQHHLKNDDDSESADLKVGRNA